MILYCNRERMRAVADLFDDIVGLAPGFDHKAVGDAIHRLMM